MTPWPDENVTTLTDVLVHEILITIVVMVLFLHKVRLADRRGESK